MDKKGKTVLVTGSSRGIGRAIALYLAKQGYDLVIHCRTKIDEAEKVKAAAESLGVKARVLQFDVNDRKLAERLLQDDVAKNGTYYGIICNAGIAADAPFPVLSGDQWDSVISTSLNGFYNVIQPVLMEMIAVRKNARIITLSSISGLVGNRGQVNYSAAKGGVIAATKALAVELAKHKITVNSIAPGLIDTDMVKDVDVNEMKKHIPMRRIGRAEEVAALAAFLLSEEAGYITRQVIAVNGGIC